MITYCVDFSEGYYKAPFYRKIYEDTKTCIAVSPAPLYLSVRHSYKFIYFLKSLHHLAENRTSSAARFYRNLPLDKVVLHVVRHPARDTHLEKKRRPCRRSGASCWAPIKSAKEE